MVVAMKDEVVEEGLVVTDDESEESSLDAYLESLDTSNKSLLDESSKRYEKGRSILMHTLHEISEDREESSLSLLKHKKKKKKDSTTTTRARLSFFGFLKHILVFSLIFGLGLFVGRQFLGEKQENVAHHSVLTPDEERDIIEAIEAEYDMIAQEQNAFDDEKTHFFAVDDAPPPEAAAAFADTKEVMDEDDGFDPVNTLDDFYEHPSLLDEVPGAVDSLVYDNNRNLAMTHDGMHMPLMCNANLTSATCSSFSALLSTVDVSLETLTIPCGECYEVDITDSSQLVLEHGLRIEGKLYFPSSASVTIRTKFVWVLGLLKMDTPDITNQVKFSLFGDELQTFVSSGDGHCSSMSGGCNMGSKVIAVHGGQVDIKGIEEGCPGWEKLTDVGESQPVPMDPPCNTWNTANYGTNCWTDNVIELTGACSLQASYPRIYCPIKSKGAFIGSGTREAIKFTSIAGPTSMKLPCNTWNTANAGTECWTDNEIVMRGACVDEGSRVRCPINNKFAWVGSGSRDAIKFTNKATGEVVMTTSYIIHWSWGYGSNMYLKPDVWTTNPSHIGVINSMFTTGDVLTVDLVNTPPPLGQSMTSSDIIHWSWGGNGLYFRPDQTVEEINSMFKTGYQLRVDKVSSDTELYDIKVSPEAASCWAEGTEVLLTSHTRNYNDQQVVTIESTDPVNGMIRFTTPIATPLSKADHPDFAVEVASLNRRIVFEADDDANDSSIGGHFVVHHTPSVQHIEGVEIKNFGQQGRLGKYPLHFHMCGDSHGSMIKKNVVRESNQRCYVVHLTNHLTLEDNVAYDAVGHCYFIEDGAEVENTFTRNLGSGIHIMPQDRVDQLEASSGREESDGAPQGFNGASVFWISNPQNHFVGNVAAGGDKNCFWFETRDQRVSMSLGTFKDNEAHGCKAMAFSVYAPGWRPNEVALIDNIKVYRNQADGAFLHVTKNLYFQGGLFADNVSKDVFISRGDNLVFDGTHFMGQTEFTSKACGSTYVGIQLDPFRLHETVLGHFSGTYKGSTVKNAIFENYSLAATGCNTASAPMRFYDHQSFLEAYTAITTIQDVQFIDSPSPTLDACMPGSGFDDVQVEIASDIHGAFTGQQGFLVNPTFSTTGCQSYNSCLDFCPGACLRTVTVVAGDSSFPEDIVMIVSNTITGDSMTINRDVRGYPEPTHVTNQYSGAYTAVLPKGTYSIRFENSVTGELVWPGYAFPALEAAPTSCAEYVEESDLTFMKPETGRPACDQLIKNGNFDTAGIDGWNGFWSNVNHVTNLGVDGSGALATSSTSSSGCWPTQVLDASCLQVGMQYEVQVSYKIVDSSYTTEVPDATSLPRVRVYTQVYDDTTDLSNKRLVQTSNQVIATTSIDSPTSGWRTVNAIWDITDANILSADVLKLNIEGAGSNYLLIDNVSVQRVDNNIITRHTRGLRH